MTTTRCSWANMADPRYLDYHDHEWGVAATTRIPVRDAESGRRAGGPELGDDPQQARQLPAAFDGLDPEIIARYDAAKVAELLADAGIVRNRLKVAAAITNAQAYLRCARRASRSTSLWGSSTARRRQRWPTVRGRPRPSSDRMSKDLANAASSSSARPSSTPTCRASAGRRPPGLLPARRSLKDMDFRPHWRGRERFVIFDSHWSDGAAFAALADAWRADPHRPKRLHVIVLADGGLPGSSVCCRPTKRSRSTCCTRRSMPRWRNWRRVSTPFICTISPIPVLRAAWHGCWRSMRCCTRPA